METKILVIGHSQFPRVVVEGLKFVSGIEEDIDYKYIDNDHSIDELKNDLEKYLEKCENIIIFADLPGGSPHRLAVETIEKTKKKNAIVIAGAGMPMIMDIAFKVILIKFKSFDEIICFIGEKKKNLDKYIMITGA
ncbi:PTS sugar transporter subunit IIA [Mycoplasmopsis fermentans]|nr:PTS sugar transporter subunit IIA [Mycoplasmopsis fermentans]